MMPISVQSNRCVICTVVVLCSYSVLTICLLDTTDIPKLISMFLNVNLMNRTHIGDIVHGYGTIMVDVRKLGQMDFDKMDVGNTTKTHQNKPQCFRLIWNEGKMSSGNYTDLKYPRKIQKGENCKSYIALTTAPGRTGNQMFQLAALLGTAYHLDMMPLINPSFPLTQYFNLPNLFDNKLKDSKSFSYHRSSKYNSRVLGLDRRRNLTMDGYFQSWRYFEGLESVIRRVFQVKDVFLEQPKQFLSSLTFKGHTKVCIHVRRGDFTDQRASMNGYSMADIHFLQRAMEFHRERWGKVRFIVLSDGIAWCKEKIIGPDIMFSPFYHVAEDFALMTLCDHVVVTSGTFGWWGAWLSGGTTVYYKNYPRPGSWLEKQFSRDDYYPPNWIGL
ncbi:hypothetical protein ACF0H5_005969 [Mactra antiquata]